MDIDQGLPFAIPVLMFLLVAVIAVIGFWLSAQRRKALEQFAASMGWSFSSSDPFGIPSTYGYFDCLNKGDKRRAGNVLWGEYGGLEFQAFEYHYEAGSGDEKNTTNMSVVIGQARYALNPISIRPENFMDHFAGALGFTDITFEWDAFNRAFHVKANDKRYAYDVINQKMMEFLMANPGWCVEVFAKGVLIHRGENVFKPEEYVEALNFLRAFLDQLPEYLEEKLQSG